MDNNNIIQDVQEEIVSSSTSTITNKSNKTTNIYNCVELLVFIFFSSYCIAENVIQNIILYNTCTVSYGLNKSICEVVVSSNHSNNETKHLEDIIQEQVSKIIMTMSLLQGIFPAFLSLFLGPWSDTHGRKPLLISSFLGFSLYFGVIIIFLQINSLNPWWYVIASLPFSILGGTPAVIMGILCYVCDITDNDNRSYRLGFIEGFIFGGSLVGNLGSSYILKFLGYTFTIVLCAVLGLIACLYSAFILRESVNTRSDDRRHILDYTYVLNMIKVCCQNRENYGRWIIWMVMLSSCLSILSMFGESSVYYLFVRERFSWDLKEYSQYTASSSCFDIIGIIIIGLIMKYFHARDSLVSSISYMMACIKSIVTYFVTFTWQMYLVSGLTFIRSVSSPINRSILSKIVPVEDIGKVMSLTTSLETIIPLAATPLYAIFYQKTFIIHPGAFSLLSACSFGIGAILLGVVEYILMKYPSTNYRRITAVTES